MEQFFATYMRIFFILTPFFILSVFLAMTSHFPAKTKKLLALRVGFAVLVLTVGMYLFGKYIFALFGITIDAFRIGAGALLFLSAVTLIKGRPDKGAPSDDEDIAVVPLAIPTTVGPGTIGLLMVMGGDAATIAEKVSDISAIAAASVSLGLLLLLSGQIERLLGLRGLSIMSKITGLFVSSIAAQMIFSGIKSFFS